MSRIVTENPAAAHACAIPAPIVPAPTTAIFLTWSSPMFVPESVAESGASGYSLRGRVGPTTAPPVFDVQEAAESELRRSQLVPSDEGRSFPSAMIKRGCQYRPSKRRNGSCPPSRCRHAGPAPRRRGRLAPNYLCQGGGKRAPVDRGGLLGILGHRWQFLPRGDRRARERRDPPRERVRCVPLPRDNHERLGEHHLGFVVAARGPRPREDLDHRVWDYDEYDLRSAAVP